MRRASSFTEYWGRSSKSLEDTQSFEYHLSKVGEFSSFFILYMAHPVMYIHTLRWPGITFEIYLQVRSVSALTPVWRIVSKLIHMKYLI